MNANEPLAYRMSPKTLEDYVGQEEILGQERQIDYLALYYGDLLDAEKRLWQGL